MWVSCSRDSAPDFAVARMCSYSTQPDHQWWIKVLSALLVQDFVKLLLSPLMNPWRQNSVPIVEVPMLEIEQPSPGSVSEAVHFRRLSRACLSFQTFIPKAVNTCD